jgi:hypothetical protein
MSWFSVDSLLSPGVNMSGPTVKLVSDEKQRCVNLSGLRHMSVGSKRKGNAKKFASTALLAFARPMADQISARAAIRSLFPMDETFESVVTHYSRVISLAGPAANDEQLGANSINFSTQAATAYADFSPFATIFDEYKVLAMDCRWVGAMSPSATSLVVTAATIQPSFAIAFDPEASTAPATTMTSDNMARPTTILVSKSANVAPTEWKWKHPFSGAPWADMLTPSTTIVGGASNGGCIYFLVDPNDSVLATTLAQVYGYLHLRVAMRFRVRH